VPRVSPSLLRAERRLCRGDLGRLSAIATLIGVAADIEQAEVSQLGYPLPLGFPLVAIVGHLIEDDPGRVMLLKPRGQLGVAGPEPLSATGAAVRAQLGAQSATGPPDVDGPFPLIDNRVDQATTCDTVTGPRGPARWAPDGGTPHARSAAPRERSGNPRSCSARHQGQH